MIPINDEIFNNLDWKLVDGEQIDSILEGLQIIGAEPAGYPLTDSVIIYATNNETGQFKVIDIGIDLMQADQTENPLYIGLATL